MVDIPFRNIWFIFKQITDITFQIIADTGKYRQIHTSDLVPAIIVELRRTDTTVFDYTILAYIMFQPILFNLYDYPAHVQPSL